MIYKIVGIGSKFDYVGKKDNKQHTAQVLHCVRRPIERDGQFSGLVTEDKFFQDINLGKVAHVQLDKVYDFRYESDGRYLYLASVTEVEKF